MAHRQLTDEEVLEATEQLTIGERRWLVGDPAHSVAGAGFEGGRDPRELLGLREAARLRADHNQRTPDAVQPATAISQGAGSFLTNDTGLERATEIRVLDRLIQLRRLPE
ncbi:MAG: hypothetical protein M3P70_14200 [Actinomycetota bacterium]|nr:hypothetical protein [Actinomycetota bacterium]